MTQNAKTAAQLIADLEKIWEEFGVPSTSKADPESSTTAPETTSAPSTSTTKTDSTKDG